MPPSSAEDALHNAILPTVAMAVKSEKTSTILAGVAVYYSASTVTRPWQRLFKVRMLWRSNSSVVLMLQPSIIRMENHPIKSVVMAEFKKPGADIFENNKALMQCRLYASELGANPYCVGSICLLSSRNRWCLLYEHRQAGFKRMYFPWIKGLSTMISSLEETMKFPSSICMPASALSQGCEGPQQSFWRSLTVRCRQVVLCFHRPTLFLTSLILDLEMK